MASQEAVGQNLRISGAQAEPRSESDIRIDPGGTDLVIAAANSVNGAEQSQFSSGNDGATWSQTVLPLVSGDSFQSDPTVSWTNDGTAWTVTIGVQGGSLRLRAYRSTDGGGTWTFDGTASGSHTAADKELMCSDGRNLYVIWHNGRPAFVNRRIASTASWSTPVQVSGAETTGTAIGGDITTNRVGEVFAFWPDTGSRGLFVARSTNSAASFGTPTRIATTFAAFDIGVPAFASRRALIYLSGAAYDDGVNSFVYAVWTDLTGEGGCTSSGNEPDTNAASNCKSRIWFARSSNGGANWEPPNMLNNPTSRNDQFNPRLAVDDDDGTMVVVYYDTAGDSTRRATNLWYQSSADNGTTWTTATRITTAPTDETIAGRDSGNQYGDYNGLTGHRRRFFPSWTDRRSGGSEEIWTARLQPDSVTDYIRATTLSQP